MFFHNFKYTLRTLFKNKMLIFWTFLFPIILGTFFYMAFSNIEDSEKLSIIPIAIVNNEQFQSNTIFKTVFTNLGLEEKEERLFDISYVSEEEAKKLLEENKIDGYLLFQGHEPTIMVKKSGINETILKLVTEKILEMESMITNITNYKVALGNNENDLSFLYTEIYTEIMQLLEESHSNIKDISNSNLSYTMIEYYTLIALTCLYGGILGLTAVNQNLANMSSKGKRIAVSPTKKGSIIFSSVLASFLIQLMGIALLFLYTIVVLKVDYGNHFLPVVVLAIVGCLAGLSLGIGVASLLKWKENAKVGMIIALTMIGSFLSGMMGITMKYTIDKNIPLLNQINPANMITDGLYSLYYYETLNRFYFNVISLLIFSLFVIGISIFSLRRQKYDCI